MTVAQAQDFVTSTRTQLAQLKLQEAQLRRGLSIFKIEHPPSREIQTLDKDLDSLELIWELVSEWEASWDGWKQGKFGELVTDDMEMNAQGMLKRCIRLARELKVRKGRKKTIINVPMTCVCCIGERLGNSRSSTKSD